MDKLRNNIYFYIDESYKKDFLGVAIVTIIGKVNLEITKNLLTEKSKSLIFKHRNNRSSKIHFTDNNVSSRIDVIDQIYKMPVSVYMSYRKQDTSLLSKQQKDHIAYQEILPELVKLIATKYKKNFREEPVIINLNFEQLSNKKETDKKFFIKCLCNININFKVNILDKENVFIPLPDYFIGLLGDLTTNPSRNWVENSLEMIESKIGLIVDTTDKKREYYQRGDEIISFINKKSKP